MRYALLALALLAVPAAAQEHGHHGGPTAEPAWTTLPTLHSTAMGRKGAVVLARNIDAAAVTVVPPEGDAWTVPLADGSGQFSPRGVGNYHLLLARAETPDEVRVALAAHYFSNPGDAPEAILEARKSELELIPRPLPREHAHYRADQSWLFAVRFQGQPLAGAEVDLRTANGSRLQGVSDAAGLVSLTLPADFAADAVQGDHGRPASAPFVIAVSHAAEGRRYLTSFSDRYQPPALTGKWPGLGAAFLVVGMVAATPLLRRRPKGA